MPLYVSVFPNFEASGHTCMLTTQQILSTQEKLNEKLLNEWWEKKLGWAFHVMDSSRQMFLAASPLGIASKVERAIIMLWMFVLKKRLLSIYLMTIPQFLPS